MDFTRSPQRRRDMIRLMRFYPLVSVLAAVSLLSACSVFRSPSSASSQEPSATETPPGAGTAQPQPGLPPEAVPTPEPPRPPPKQFKLSPATNALVQQAHTQAHAGAFVPAANTIERALRIEPENPLLWIELGQIRLNENNPGQANSMGHKALALATGDARAQASAWRLVAESLRGLNRNDEAAEADKKANALSPR